MNVLSIDTSTELATIALAVGEEIYSEEQGSMRQHAQLLLPMIERLLALAELSFSQLDAIVFGRGPGSFTGIRIACSVAKGLAYAHDLPLYPVSSLASIAYEAYQGQEACTFEPHVLAMIDARMQQVYWGCFTRDSFEVQEQVTAATDITVPSSMPLILAGVGLDVYAPQLPDSIQARVVKQSTIFPKAKTMIDLVQGGKIAPVTAELALPVYVRNQVTQGEPRG